MSILKQEIILSGFGALDEDESMREDLEKAAKQYGVKFYPTYYDHELRGERDKIEALTQDLWSMSRDEWPENLLQETEVKED